jgi:hypothetical protein
VAKEVNEETTSICVAKESRVFFCPLFYSSPVQKLHNFQSYPVLRSQTRSKMMCGFMF